MSNQISVSIIIPVYNGEKYIETALKSVFNQTYKDYEIIVVDDGSQDNTKEILAKYLTKITYIFQANKGCSAARNKGIKNARGKYIAFLDADDIWLPEKLKMQVELISSEQSLGFIGCGVLLINEKDDFLGEIPGEINLNSSLLTKQILIKNPISGGPSGVLVLKECFDKVGFFDENLKSSEDRDMWLRIAQHFEVKIIEGPLFKYRFHNKNLHKNIADMKTSQINFIKKHRNLLNFIQRKKSYSYVYLDAAREYYNNSNYFLALKNAFLSISQHPFKIDAKDDKYKLVVKSLLPRFIRN